MPRSRKSASECPLEDVLQCLAGQWTLKIVYHLRAEPKRFVELRRDLGGVSAKVLTTRLRELEERGVIRRTEQKMYALTPFGRKFHPVLEAIVGVGKQLKKR